MRGPGSTAPPSIFRRWTRIASGSASATCARSREAHDVSVPRVALIGLLAKPHVMTVITGAKTVEQRDDKLAPTGLILSTEEMAFGRGQHPGDGISRLDVRSSGGGANSEAVRCGQGLKQNLPPQRRGGSAFVVLFGGLLRRIADHGLDFEVFGETEITPFAAIAAHLVTAERGHHITAAAVD